MENKNFFTVECCLLAFNIVELFVSRVYVASYYANHIYPCPVFSSETPAVALL